MLMDIKEKWQAFVKVMEEKNGRLLVHGDKSTTNMRVCDLFEFKELEACFRPSREEIADHLESNISCYTDETRKYLDAAIEELRKEQ